MKFPARPPTTQNTVLSAALSKARKTAASLFSVVDAEGRYLHWDQLRFKKTADDLSSEEWWALTKLARTAARQFISLTDKNDIPFVFCEPPPLKAVLRDLDMSAGGALASDASALSTGEGRLHLARSLAEEPFASSLIEGAATTRQIAKKLIFEGRAPRTKDERMVLNNYEAMLFVKAHRDEPLTLARLLELHRVVTIGTLDNATDAGRIRTTDDVRVVDETSNEVLHQPPPAAELSVRLEKLIAFANSKPDPKNWMHPLVKAFMLHFLLSYEHPFVDGNGRVARALFYWLALREGYWLIEYVSISSVIAESKITYGKAFLYTETDESDLTYFLIYHADILDTAIKQLMSFVDRKRKEVGALEKRIGDRNRPDAFNHRQSWLLNEFVRERLQRVTVTEHEKRNAVSYLTARKDLEALVEAGCLRKRRSGNTSIYSPAPDLMKVLSGR